MNAETLALVLDALLPGGEGFPSAGELRLADALRHRPEFAAAVTAGLAALPAAFATLTPDERIACLKSFEAARAEIFGAMLVAAYSAYYVDPRVLAVIERLTGYAARPPQPQGHVLPPFDPALLDIMRTRPRSYREV